MNIDKQTRWADDGCGDVMDAANGETIALVMGSRHLKAHKTRLIAAAPEMLELLNKIRGHIDSTCRECESKAIVPEIDALLDKIEGGNRGKRIKGIEQDFASTSNGVSFLVQLLASLREAVMFMEFTGKLDQSLTAEEQAWLEGAKTLLARGEKRE